MAGQSSTSDTLLERVSNFLRSEQNVSSFQGTWMVVATWNQSVPFTGTGLDVSFRSKDIITPYWQKYVHHCIYTLAKLLQE